MPQADVRLILFDLLYRDFWAAPPGPALQATFAEMGLELLDLHLLQFELQMTFGIDITGEAGVQLTDTVACLMGLIHRRLAGNSC